MDLGILQREFPVSDSIKEHANVQRGLYRLSDSFFRFWYAFVFPNMSELENGDTEGIWNYVVEPGLDNYTSYVYDDVCRQYLRRENRRNRLPFRFTKIGRWWEKAEELDILAIDAGKENFLIGECKYKNSPFACSDFKRMLGKFVPQKEESRLYYYLFSKSGFSPEVVKEAKGQKIHMIGVDELI